MMTRTAVISAWFDGTHVYDDFGARGRIIDVEGCEPIAWVNWIGKSGGNKSVRFDRLNKPKPCAE